VNCPVGEPAFGELAVGELVVDELTRTLGLRMQALVLRIVGPHRVLQYRYHLHIHYILHVPMLNHHYIHQLIHRHIRQHNRETGHMTSLLIILFLDKF
jgi:hypothetical protein